MKKPITVILLLLVTAIGWTCPVCDRQQSGLLRGITHGGSPQTKWDYLILSVMIVVVLATLFFSVRWLIQPGEKGQNHIKRVVLNFE
jgi:hypothetical protein